MLNLKIGEKKYQIKFGYKPTLKSRIISKIIAIETVEETNLATAEDLMLLIPEIILVGLQKNHKEEFGYDYDTNENREKALDKVFDLMDDYFDGEDANIYQLYGDLQKEMLQESFLKSMFQQEKAEQNKKKTTAKTPKN